MKKLVILLAAAAIASSPSAAAGKVKIVAHRGACDLSMPEASTVAYSNAVSGAADIVKLDVNRTKDSVPVMSHDPTLKRCMGWDVAIGKTTYRDILEKGTFIPAGGYEGLRIVTLGEALDIVKPLPEFWLDFKAYTPEFAEKAIAEFTRRGIAEDRIMCATFRYSALAYLQGTHPAIRRVAHVGISRLSNGSYATTLVKNRKFKTKRELLDAIVACRDEMKLFGVNMPVLKGQTLPEDVAYLKSKGLWVSLWFVQNPVTAALYKDSGVDAFVTDRASDIR